MSPSGGRKWKKLPPALVNGVLILVLSFELGFILLAQETLVSRVAAFTTLLGTAGFLIPAILPKILDVVGETIKQAWEALLQNTRLTLWLKRAVLAGVAPTLIYAPWTLCPPPLLQILPGPQVFNGVSQADVKDSSVRYMLRVQQDGKMLKEADVTGAGSIYVGRSPRKQIAWIEETPAKDQREELGRYPDAEAFLDRWMETGAGRKLIAAPLRRGCVQIDLWYVPTAGREERVGHMSLLLDTKIKQVFLEKDDDEPKCRP